MTAKRIILSVSEALEIPIEVMCSNSRKRSVVESRMIAISLIRTKCGTKKKRPKLQAIGKLFNRHHSTIINSICTYEDLYPSNKKFTLKVERVLERLL